MQITKDNLTIIIVTIRSEKIIANCLSSIDPEIKKIIIENSSNQEFVENLKMKYKNIECHLTHENLGMGSGNNFGIAKSKTRYVLILNPDTILKENTLSEIYKLPSELDFAILSPISDNKNYPNYKMKKNKSNENKPLFEVETVDGYAMLLDKTKFNNTFFDEKIFMYLENDDLCLRMKKMGEKVYVYDKSQITHLGAKTVDSKYIEEIEYSRNWHWNWSKIYFRRKHYGFLNALLFSLPSILKSSIKCIYYFLIINKIKFKIYSCRISGLFNSLLNKNSWYRPRLD